MAYKQHVVGIVDRHARTAGAMYGLQIDLSG